MGITPVGPCVPSCMGFTLQVMDGQPEVGVKVNKPEWEL